MRRHFALGEVVLLDHQPLRIEDQAGTDAFRLKNIVTNAEHSYSRFELDDLFAAGRLQFPAPRQQKGRNKPGPTSAVSEVNKCFHDLSEKLRDEANYREAYVKAFLAQNQPVFNREKIAAMIATVAVAQSDASPPSVSSVIRWIKSYQSQSGSILALVPDHKGKGKNPNQLDSVVRDLMEQVIETHWLTPRRPKGRRVYESLQGLVLNQQAEGQTGLKAPSYRTFMSYLAKVDRFYRISKQEGYISALKKAGSFGKGVTVTRPLERVEIDHTTIDVLVVDDQFGRVLGRPTLTVAIDVHTKAVVGYNLSFEKPSAVSVMECLKNVILPKRRGSEFSDFALEQWLMHGLPEVIAVDNGKEFYSQHLLNACKELTVQIEYMPPFRPWEKGSVERFFGTLNTGLLHNLDGSTKGSIASRGERNPAQDANISFSRLKMKLDKFIVDVYHQSPSEGVGKSPNQRWLEGVQKYLPSYPASAEQVRLALSRVAFRTASNKGFSLNSLVYNSIELTGLFNSNPKLGELTVKYDAHDLGQVHVLDPVSDRHFVVPCIDAPYARGMDLWTHTMIRKVAREKFGKAEAETLLRAKLELQRLDEEDRLSQSLRRRNQRKQELAARRRRTSDDEMKVQPEPNLPAARRERAGPRLPTETKSEKKPTKQKNSKTAIDLLPDLNLNEDQFQSMDLTIRKAE